MDRAIKGLLRTLLRAARWTIACPTGPCPCRPRPGFLLDTVELCRFAPPAARYPKLSSKFKRSRPRSGKKKAPACGGSLFWHTGQSTHTACCCTTADRQPSGALAPIYEGRHTRPTNVPAKRAEPHQDPGYSRPRRGAGDGPENTRGTRRCCRQPHRTRLAANRGNCADDRGRTSRSNPNRTAETPDLTDGAFRKNGATYRV